MSALLTLVERELVRFYRQKSRVIGALLTPLLFWLFIGGGIGRSFNPGGAGSAGAAGSAAGAGGPGGAGVAAAGSSGFLEYFFPGTLILIVFFTAIFSTISIIEDRREGFLQSVLVSPVSRLTMAAGKIVGGALLALIQALIFLALAPLAGIALTPVSVAITLLTTGLVALGLTGLGFLIAWQMDSTQGFHAIMNVFLIPLWLLSGAVFPASGAQGWLRVGMAINPISYGVAGVRRALYFGRPEPVAGIPSLAVSLLVTAVFSVVTLVLSGWLAGRRTRVSA